YPINEVVPNQLTIPIGGPIANTTVYILDSLFNLVPIGVNGEIYIGGPGVCRGYLNNPSLTAEKFLPNPFGTGDTLYRTGDLGRWLEDGSVQFNGRIDHQVKIRGYRVEPGEIESRLLNHDGIDECKVTAREDQMGSRYLCAYLVSSGTIDVMDVKDHLSRVLPDFMVPAYFVPLEKFPLNASGKIDQSKLPDPLLSLDEAVEPPRDDLELQLVQTWSEVLGVNESLIGRDGNFFHLGGHSLKATALASALHKALNVKVPLVEIFSRQTVKELARFIREAAIHRHAAIEPVEKKEYYPLSSAQMRLYILQQMDIEGTVYNIPTFIPLPVEPDTSRLEGAFNQLILRHESLRTSFHVMGDRQQVQRVHDEAALETGYFKTRLYSSVLKDFIRPFDLSRAPLMRVMVIDGGNSHYMLMADIHHIVSDGVSQGVLEKDFMALYSGETLPPLRLHYKDYSAWQADQQTNEDFIKQETYWLEQFDTGAHGEVPVLSLPLDSPRPPVQRFEGNTVNFGLSAEDTSLLKSVASETGSTLFMVLLSVTTILLSRLSGQEDIVIGTPIAARRHADLEKIIGMFVNTLALRNYSHGEKTVEDFLKQVKESTLGAFEHQEYPFEDLVEKVKVARDTSRNPLFDVLLSMENFDWLEDSYIAGPPGDDVAASSGQATQEGWGDRTAKFDLSFTFRESHGKLTCRLNYCSHLFNRETIQRFTGYFKEIVSTGLGDLSMELSQIQIITPEEQQRLLVEFNGVEREYPIGKPLPNVQLYILNRYHQFQPIGIPGEIYIGGDGVAGDYLNQPALTMEKFALYKTGDLARWLPDGNIQFLGRVDQDDDGIEETPAEKVAPRDEIEETLAKIWSELLYPNVSMEDLGIDDNFFEVGGHSLKATFMVVKIKKEMDVEVPMVEVLKTPFIRQLGEYIKASGALEVKKGHRDIVLLGREYPEAGNLFLVHDGRGEVEGYVEFCKHLDTPVNCWGIRAEELDNYTPEIRSIDAVAASYIEKIRSIQPRGPYMIGGWSLGGAIAFEIVRRLELSGDEVSFLAIFDSSPPQSPGRSPTDAQPFTLEMEKSFIRKYLKGRDIDKGLESITEPEKMWPFVVESLETGGFDPAIIREIIVEHEAHVVPNYDQLGVGALIRYLNNGRTFRNAMASYIPSSKLSTPVHYFAAGESTESTESMWIEKDRWNNYCEVPIRVYEVVGDHYSIFKKPNVSELARVVSKLLADTHAVPKSTDVI
ncbi:MAG: AMP-binding protein, partial [bacterium]|nr:AMP-binding protein [bacterium]